jgi:hypothetical protein
MRWWPIRTCFRAVGGLPLAISTGCANHSMVVVGPPPAPLMVPPEDLVPSRSDRLRGDLIRASTSEPDLIITPPRREPQPPAQSDGVPLRDVDEPDLRDVIDWLLKERR